MIIYHIAVIALTDRREQTELRTKIKQKESRHMY